MSHMELHLTTHAEDATIALGEALGRALAPGDIIALHGELGAGKTRLVRGIAAGAGADPARVSSPTFVVMQEYACAPGRAISTLVHADAYRLGGPDELESIGWDRIAADLAAHRPVAAVIEWAERIEAALPAGAVRLDVRMAHGVEPDERRLVLTGPDAWTARAGWRGVAAFAGRGEEIAPDAERKTRLPTRCPITGKPVSADSPTYPFFDEKARLADLGRWMSGSYTVSRDLTPDDEDLYPDQG
jgi:tRNA threonylcarbamoyladenosine biosynthesis protein TsaE